MLDRLAGIITITIAIEPVNLGLNFMKFNLIRIHFSLTF